MNSLFDKLNLRPQERRLIVVVGVAVFVVANYMFVWSHFGDLGIFQQQKRDATQRLNSMHREIDQVPQYEQERNQLRESGRYVPSYEASTLLRRQVRDQALASNVRLGTYTPRDTVSSSNSFFEEKGLVVTYQAGEKELVDFLYNLGTNESLIRVSEFTVGPDKRLRTELEGRITFVGSFQKNPSARPAATTPATTSPPTRAQPVTPPVAATPTPTPAPAATPKTKSSAATTPTPSSPMPSTAKTKTSPGIPSRNPRPTAATNMGVQVPRRVIPGNTNDS